jgi:2-dehydropantoate 2-reductase
MRVAVLGAGGIGGFIAGALARSGVDVCVVARGKHLEAIRARGLHVISELGDFVAGVEATDDLRDFGDLDYVLLTFKSQQWGGVLEQLERAIAQRSMFVTLQNGLPFWYSRDRALQSVDPGGKILAAMPYERIIGGVVHASGTIVEPGVVRQSGGVLYPMGEPDGSLSERVAQLSQAFAVAGLQAPVETHIRRNIWRKLVNNMALNPVSALTRSTVKRMLEDPRVRELLRAIIDEGLTIARASGVEPGVDADERLRWAEHIADVKTSMLQDLEAGRPLELEPITGAALELARLHHVDAPHTETVHGLTKLLEAAAVGH